MTTADLPHLTSSTLRSLLLPVLLLGLLAASPWVATLIEHRFPGTPFVPEAIACFVTIGLGGWVLALIERDRRRARHHLQQLEQLSRTDSLTGLGNRRALERELDLALRRSSRLRQPLALLYMDVDDLKYQNDRFGHATGDETLRCLGAVLRSSVRLGVDAGYRVGGDEFVMVLATDRPGAERVAKRVAWCFHERSPHRSRVSLGVVEWDGLANAAELLSQADRRMYRHKRPAPELSWE